MDLGALDLVDQRADVGIGLDAAPEAQLLHARGHAAGELVGDAGLDVEAVGGRAGLAHVAQLGHHRLVDGELEVGVVEDQERGVAAELHRDAQHATHRARREHAADLGRAGEGQLAQARVVEQRVGDGARARGRDDVEHAAGQAGLL